MQITSRSKDRMRNVGGSIEFGNPNVYRRKDHHYEEPKKRKSQIMNLRRLRSFKRTGDRKNRAKGAGTMVAVFMLLIFLLALILALMGVPLKGDLW